jgi:hypothetical protein
MKPKPQTQTPTERPADAARLYEQAIVDALDQAIPAMIITNKRVDLERVVGLANEAAVGSV